MKGLAFARMRKITNVTGAVNYINRSEEFKTKEEDLLAKYQTMDNSMWKALGEFNQSAFSKAKGVAKKGTCIEAREIFFHVPKSWADNPEYYVKMIAEDWKDTFGTDCAVAMHWNTDRTCLHVHLIFSERERIDSKDLETYSRNMYFDKDWKRTTKANAVHVKKKGEVKNPNQLFSSAKKKEFKSYNWLEKTVKDHYAELTGLERFKHDGIHLPEQKVSKHMNKSISAEIKQLNEDIAVWNEDIDYLLSENNLETLSDNDKRNLRANIEHKVTELKQNGKSWRTGVYEAHSELVNEYSFNLEFDWNTQRELSFELENLEKELYNVKADLRESEENIYFETQKPFFKRDKQKIRALDSKIIAFKEKIQTIQSKIQSIKNSIEKTRQQIKKTAPELYEYALTRFTMPFKKFKGLYKSHLREKERTTQSVPEIQMSEDERLRLIREFKKELDQEQNQVQYYDNYDYEYDEDLEDDGWDWER